MSHRSEIEARRINPYVRAVFIPWKGEAAMKVENQEELEKIQIEKAEAEAEAIETACKLRIKRRGKRQVNHRYSSKKIA